jgi:hypothetical protein
MAGALAYSRCELEPVGAKSAPQGRLSSLKESMCGGREGGREGRRESGPALSIAHCRTFAQQTSPQKKRNKRKKEARHSGACL